uniref:Uncharacterized protein n=1 Tax=Zooxanthella nutricula TaxID=1333877 RepID=A0A6U6QTQ2_9DINO|mmetsp:Transcript_68201/g.209128  ORF Transcript_68201/g.209128 Transcript_68201/m.209128 type:complete len:162 (+) Transcript_68201:118-603(+)
MRSCLRLAAAALALAPAAALEARRPQPPALGDAVKASGLWRAAFSATPALSRSEAALAEVVHRAATAAPPEESPYAGAKWPPQPPKPEEGWIKFEKGITKFPPELDKWKVPQVQPRRYRPGNYGPPWYTMFDPEYWMYYYWNSETGESFWKGFGWSRFDPS